MCVSRPTPVSLLPLLQRLSKEAESSKARCADYKAQLLDAQAAAEEQQATEAALREEQQRREQGSHAYSLQQIQLQNARRGIESLQQQLRCHCKTTSLAGLIACYFLLP